MRVGAQRGAAVACTAAVFLLGQSLMRRLTQSDSLTGTSISTPQQFELDTSLPFNFHWITNRLGDPLDSAWPKGTRVPFYLYTGAPFRIRPECEAVLRRHTAGFKHGNDAWAVAHGSKHAWRVFNIHDAKLFIVPLLIGVPSNALCQLQLEEVIANVTSTPQFQRNQGRDHLVITTHYKLNQPGRLVRELRKRLRNVIWGVQIVDWGLKLGGSCSFAVPMNTRVQQLTSESMSVWAARPHAIYFQGQIDRRPGYAPRVNVGKLLEEMSTNESSARILKGAMYIASREMDTGPRPASDLRLSLPPCNCTQHPGVVTAVSGHECINCRLRADVKGAWSTYNTDIRASRFGLHIRGDNPGSNRLYDLIAAGTIPIVVSDHVNLTLPFPNVVPWDQIIVRVPETPGSHQRAALFRALTLDANEIERRRFLLRRHAADVLWEVNESRVFSNILVAATRNCLTDSTNSRHTE